MDGPCTATLGTAAQAILALGGSGSVPDDGGSVSLGDLTGGGLLDPEGMEAYAKKKKIIAQIKAAAAKAGMTLNQYLQLHPELMKYFA